MYTRGILGFAAAVLLAAGPAKAQLTGPAQQVVNRAAQASGGLAAWNGLRGLHETGKSPSGEYQRWLDPIRYGLRTEVDTAEGRQVSGFNGLGEWRILPDGGNTGSDAGPNLREARSDAFFGTFGYFFPGRFEFRGSVVGTRTAQDRQYDVVSIEPLGGEPRELWFDRRTGLVTYIVDETGPRQGRTELGDYRRTGRVMLPFRITTYGGGRDTFEVIIEKIETVANDRTLFSLPRPD